MKNFISTIAILLYCFTCQGQATNPYAWVQFGDDSTHKGIMLPRVSDTTAFASDSCEGMFIYSYATKDLFYSNGTSWVNASRYDLNNVLKKGNIATDPIYNNIHLRTYSSGPTDELELQPALLWLSVGGNVTGGFQSTYLTGGGGGPSWSGEVVLGNNGYITKGHAELTGNRSFIIQDGNGTLAWTSQLPIHGRATLSSGSIIVSEPSCTPACDCQAGLRTYLGASASPLYKCVTGSGFFTITATSVTGALVPLDNNQVSYSLECN